MPYARLSDDEKKGERVRKSSSHVESLGAEYHKETERLAPRMLFFALIVLLAHTLKIEPSSFDAGGIKIAIENVAVVHGGVALVFLFYLFQVVLSSINGSDLLPFSSRYATMRSRLNKASKRFKDPKTERHRRRTPHEVKRHARGSIALLNWIVVPVGLVIFLIVSVALIVALYDAAIFVGFIEQRLEELEYLPPHMFEIA